jgi:hypothetical protein
MAIWGFLLSPLLADDDIPKAAPVPSLEGEDHGPPAASVPEPNTLLVAGIGSLAIMLFAFRRK